MLALAVLCIDHVLSGAGARGLDEGLGEIDAEVCAVGHQRRFGNGFSQMVRELEAFPKIDGFSARQPRKGSQAGQPAVSASR